MIKRRRSESGQALALLVLAIVGLLGFSALALDGGMLLSERRHAQNAADSAALAAALAKIKGYNWKEVALQRAESNGYSTTAGNCSPAGYDCVKGIGEKWTVQVSNPPRNGAYKGNSAYIQVTITSQVPSSFAHLIFKGPLQNTSEAVSRTWPPDSITPGHALYGINPHQCKTIWFSGTGDTVIDGGNVFSNSDASSSSCESGVQDGAGAVTVNPPDQIQVVGVFDAGGSGTVDPTPVSGVPQQILRPVPLPDCSGLPNFGPTKINANAHEILDPGIYDFISVGAGANVRLNSGMYCVTGSKGFTGNGGKITGRGVMIYLMSGPFDLGGNTLVDLQAEDRPNVLVDPSQNDWKGMLIYADPTNTSDIKITGTSNTAYTGTIYSPASSCTVQGTGDSLGLYSQLICDTVKITGTAQVQVFYVPDQNYYLPPALELAQ